MIEKKGLNFKYMDTKKHYKMYKSGKKWCYAAIATLSVALGAFAANGATAQADDVNPSTILNTTSASTDTNSTATENVASTVTTPQANTKAESANQNVASVESSSASTSDTTKQQVSQPTTWEPKNVELQKPSTIADQSNNGSLDSISISNGQLNVNGWNASNQDYGKDYHYIIVYDQSQNKELGRQLVQNTQRDDVQKAYPNVYNSQFSGFNVSFNITSADYLNDNIQIVSRYTSDPMGNTNYVDRWFSPVTFKNNETQSIDYITNNGDGTITVSGTDANNQTYGKSNHYIILYDVTTGKQLDAVKVNNTASDLAYNNVYNAGNAKFTAQLNYGGLTSLNDRIAIVSRYSSYDCGNGDDGVASHKTDHWFYLDNTNRSNLDNFDLSNGSNLTVSGWNANDNSVFANNHYLILFDNTTQKQVAYKKVTTIDRSDVEKAYQQYVIGNKSGFDTIFDSSLLTKGHNYSVVSRYSTSADGNGNDGLYSDNWMGNITIDGAHYAIDSIKQTASGIQLTGWMADNAQVDGENNAFIIVLNNGKEIARQKVALTQRADVANAYKNISDSLNSGFNTTINLNTASLNGNLQFVLRFAGADGETNHSDQYTQTYATNAGNIDTFNINGNSIQVSGWHAAMNAEGMNHEFIIVTDLNGNELYRTELTSDQKNISRNDVANACSWIANANQSGFSTSLPLTDAMQHKGIKVIHRLTSSADGNSNYSDFTTVEYINSGWQGNSYYDPYTGQKVTGTVTIDGKSYTFDNNGNLMTKQQRAVDKALSAKGTPYVWGGNKPGGFDCSGLVQWAYGLGSNYRTTYQQTTLGAHHRDVYNAPKGALVFFGSDSAPYHVGISLGNGTFVHAPEPGDVVKTTSMRYYTPSYYIVLN